MLPSRPHRLALFSLVAMGDLETQKWTEAVILDPSNAKFVPKIENPTQEHQLGINIGFHIGNPSRDTLAILGRNGDIKLKDENFSRTQCSFEVVPESGVVMLCDRSTLQTAQLVGNDAFPYERGRSRRVAVTSQFNTTFGIGQRG
jgi:hypothetical protein